MNENSDSFDLHKHLVSGGEVRITWVWGAPGHVINASWDAVVEGEPSGYYAIAYDASGEEVAFGESLDQEAEAPTPRRAMERLRCPYRKLEEPLDPDGPPF
ncbi:hypothetical protein [Nocardiopsis synnemataformans]|uniref:hypothetical protein n=1 Tax=Nocardiopsis synnemataformans TaxID=61305 RepID=UPI003EBCDF28